MGVNVIKKFLNQNCYIFAVVQPDNNLSRSIPIHQNIQIVPLKMSEYDKIDQAINTSCDYFFHFAWNGTRGSSRDDKVLQEVNVIDSMKAIQGAITLGCTTILDAGSTAEYGPIEKIITENDPCQPNTEYGKAKYKLFVAITELCKKNQVHYKHLRIFSLYGPGDFEQALIPSVIQKLLSGHDVLLTACTQKWDFLHIQDACEGIIKILDPKVSEGIYNFGSGDNRPLKEFIELIYKITSSKSKVIFGGIPYPKTGRVSLELDTTKVRKETGWIPRILFENGVKEMVESIKLLGDVP